MNLDRYDYQTNKDLLNYEFFSDGPNGRIKKIVRFTPRNVDGITYFNLIFGDWNDKKKRIDDLIISNNNDKDKVLATVAKIVMEFAEYFPDIWIYAQGSTPARTRLYQMGIATYWKEIDPVLNIYGYINEIWQPFKKSVNYFAFMVSKK